MYVEMLTVVAVDYLQFVASKNVFHVCKYSFFVFFFKYGNKKYIINLELSH